MAGYGEVEPPALLTFYDVQPPTVELAQMVTLQMVRMEQAQMVIA